MSLRIETKLKFLLTKCAYTPFISDSNRKSRLGRGSLPLKVTYTVLVDFKGIIYHLLDRITLRIRTLFRAVAYTNTETFPHFMKMTFSLRRLIITPSGPRIFILIRRLILRLSIIWISRVNLIITAYSFNVSPLMKKNSVIHLFVKWRLDLIPRNIIEALYFLDENNGINLFRKSRSPILIAYPVSKQPASEGAS